jgi:hypothetical protein
VLIAAFWSTETSISSPPAPSLKMRIDRRRGIHRLPPRRRRLDLPLSSPPYSPTRPSPAQRPETREPKRRSQGRHTEACPARSGLLTPSSHRGRPRARAADAWDSKGARPRRFMVGRGSPVHAGEHGSQRSSHGRAAHCSGSDPLSPWWVIGQRWLGAGNRWFACAIPGRMGTVRD